MIEKKINKPRQLIGFVVLTALLLIGRDVFSLPLNKFVLLGITALPVVIFDYSTALAFSCFLFPLLCGTPDTYLTTIIFLSLIIKGGIKENVVIYSLIFMFLEIIGLLFYFETGINMSLYQQIVSISLFFVLLFVDRKADFSYCVKMFVIGTTLVCGVIIAYTLKQAPTNWLSLLSKGWFRFGDNNSIESGKMTLCLNSNSLGYYALSGMCCCLLIVDKLTSKKFIYIALAVFHGISGVLSISRSYMVIGAFCLILFCFTQTGNIRKFLLLIFGGIIVIGFSVYLLSNNPDLLMGIMTRFSDNTMSTGGGRTNLILRYLEAFMSTPRTILFGVGATNYRLALGMPTSVHNGTEQILVCYGFVGFSVFVGGMISSFVKAVKENEKKQLIYFLPIISVVLFTQTIQFINPCYLMMPFVIGIFAIRSEKESNYGR